MPEFFGIQAGKLVGVNEDGTAEFLQLKGIRFDGYQHG